MSGRRARWSWVAAVELLALVLAAWALVAATLVLALDVVVF
jgi:uncharacterized membrane protein